MSNRARWADSAQPVVDATEAIKYLSIGQLSDATGLSQETLQDSLTREEITNPDNPRITLCRPLYRLGNTPLWDQGQLRQYFTLLRKAQARASKNLSPYAPVEADKKGLVTTKEIAERLQVHDQTVRRWQRDHVFPLAVGELHRFGEPGVPDHLRSWQQVLAWVRSHPRLRIHSTVRETLFGKS